MAVYCGHQMGNNPEFERDAKKLGELMAKNKIRLIFGGGNVGLMGAIASAVIENKGEVIGISTENVTARQEPPIDGAKIEIVGGLNERKQKMIELSNAFCILPGGIGTLNELTDIMTMQQVGESKKPIYFMNTDKYWDIFGNVLVHMQDQGFISSMNEYKITVFETPEQVIEAFNQKDE